MLEARYKLDDLEVQFDDDRVSINHPKETTVTMPHVQFEEIFRKYTAFKKAMEELGK